MPVTKMSNTNPDFFRTLVAETGAETFYTHRTVLISALNDLTIGQGLEGEIYHSIPGDTNLTIQALQVTLAGPIVIPRGDVRIVCKTLRVPPGAIDPKTNKARFGAMIDVSARAQTPIEKPFDQVAPITDASPNGTPGADGDQIAKSLQAGDGKYMASTSPLPYGTDGAKGGTLTLCCDELILLGDLLLAADGQNGFPGVNGQAGSPAAPGLFAGAGGKGGRGGRGGDAGSIDVKYHSADHPERLISHAEPGRAGLAGKPGHAGNDVRRRTGAAADPTPSAALGTVRNLLVDLPTLGTHADDVLLVKLVERVKRIYLFNQPTRYVGEETTFPKVWKQLGLELKWLVDVVGEPAADSSRTRLYDELDELSDLYKRKKTSFGWDASWVPSLKLDVMLADFDRSFGSRKAAETAYFNLDKEFADAKAQALARVDAQAAITQVKAVQVAKFKAAADQLAVVNVQVKDAVTACDSAKAHLKTQLEALKPKIAQSFDVSIESVLSAVEMFVFTMGGESAQGLAMGSVQVASLVNQGLNKIRDNDGNPVDKSQILSEVQAVGKSIVNAAQGQLFIIDDDGKPKVDETHKNAIAKLNEFKEYLGKFSAHLDAQAITKVTDALTDFQNLAIEKGKAIVTYQLLTSQLIQAYTDYEDAVVQEKELGKGNPIDPTAVATVAYYARLYQTQLEATMEDFAALQRKFAYVKLGATQSEFATAAGSSWEDGRRPNLNDIMSNRAAMQSEFDKWSASQPGSADPFPKGGNRSILSVVIGEGELLAQFRRTGKISFRTVIGDAMLPIVGPRSLVNILNSEQFFDIRLTHVLPRVIGATTANGSLLLKARMTTWSEIYDMQHRAHRFSHHVSRTATITHINSTADVADDSDVKGDDDGQLVGHFLDAVGAFTEWTVWVPETIGQLSANADCNLAGVTSIVMHFRGSHRTL